MYNCNSESSIVLLSVYCCQAAVADLASATLHEAAEHQNEDDQRPSCHSSQYTISQISAAATERLVLQREQSWQNVNPHFMVANRVKY